MIHIPFVQVTMQKYEIILKQQKAPQVLSLWCLYYINKVD